MTISDEIHAEATSPTIEGRRAQAFPTLSRAEIDRMRRFGSPRRYADGEKLFEIGKPSAGMHVILAGHVRITGRDAHHPIGDVRAGSVKRVGAAIGEGAAVVAQVHAHLAAHAGTETVSPTA
jgi:hypothetical protein